MAASPLAVPGRAPAPAPWAKLIDHSRCIGCHACTTACKSENLVPVSVTRTYVKYVDVGLFPNSRRAFQVTRCNQCEAPPCVAACPTAAMYQRADGIVDFDKSVCIGCKACMAACPYDAIFINPEDHSAEKCNFCAHRLAIGLEPACVVVCPTEAIAIGTLSDMTSRVSRVSQREAVAVRRPEKGTRPKLFYKGAHQATLDPLGATRPEGGLYMWSEQPAGPHIVGAGSVDGANVSSRAVVAYDVAHRAPWDWRVSAYTWTKSVAAGAYLVPLVLVLLGIIDADHALWRWAAPIVGGAFMAFTAVLLILDLEHPLRFPLILVRPQWRSWLVRGGVIITAFGAVLVAHFTFSLLGRMAPTLALAWAGGPLALLAAVYTAYLLAQARGRDLWQSALLPLQLAVQAAMAGGAALAPVALFTDVAIVPPLLWATGIAAFLQLLLALAEISVPHPTAQARAAAHAMTSGEYARWFAAAVVLSAVAVLAPWLGAPAAIAALAGLAAFEHAFIQAGQAAPLA